MQTPLKMAVATCWLALVACQHSIGQNRILISDPQSEGPQVIQIRPSSGQIYSVQPQQSSNIPAQPQPQTAKEPAPAESAPASSAAAAAPAVASVPPVHRPRAPLHSYNRIQTTRPVVALTFDDGPHPQLTPKLLDLLKERNIRATFYVIGRNVEAYPEITRRIVEEGHEIGNHSFSHPALSKVGAARVKSEIERTNAAIRQATGVLPRTMRPPYGATNAALNRRLREEFDLPVILWSVDPQDWKYRNSTRVSSHIIEHSQPGDIILAHDIHPSTIDAMPRALDALLARGLQFVTVSELLEMGQEAESAPATHEMVSADAVLRPRE